MNAVTPHSEYGYRASALRTTRDTEYDAFSRVTQMLRQSELSESGMDAVLAVHKNNELWTILASDLASPGNGLADEVKAGLLSLAGCSLRHGHRVLAREASIDLLVDINMAVMRGLRGEVEA